MIVKARAARITATQAPRDHVSAKDTELRRDAPAKKKNEFPSTLSTASAMENIVVTIRKTA